MMIEIDGIRYPVIGVYDSISSNNIPCKIIEMYSTYEEVVNLFTEGVKWQVIEQIETEVTSEGEDEFTVKHEEYITDCSLFSIPGTITIFRNGRISLEMAQASIDEILKLFEGVL